MKILITGVTGFIGNYLVSYLKDQHELFLVARDPKLLSGQDNVIAWDFSNPINENDFPKEVDVVIHLAQARNYRDLIADSEEMFQVNTASTLQLAQWAAKIQAKHFCYVSSGSVYEPSEALLREDQPLLPSSFLGASKYAAEVILEPFQSLFSVSVLRLFTPYGPNQTARLIPTLVGRIQQEQSVMVTGDEVGSCFGEIYYQDVLRVIERAMTECWQGIYNVANTCLSIKDMAHSIGRSLGVEPRFEYRSDLPKIKLCPDVSKLNAILGTWDFVDFSVGIEQTVKAFLNEGECCEK